MWLSYKNVESEQNYAFKLSEIITKDLRLDTVKPLNITVELQHFYNDDRYGYCVNRYNDYKDFRIVLDKELSFTAFTNALAHELRHINQKVFNTHEAIVTMDMYNQVQDNYSKCLRTSEKRDNVYLFSGFFQSLFHSPALHSTTC